MHNPVNQENGLNAYFKQPDGAFSTTSNCWKSRIYRHRCRTSKTYGNVLKYVAGGVFNRDKRDLSYYQTKLKR